MNTPRPGGKLTENTELLAGLQLVFCGVLMSCKLSVMQAILGGLWFGATWCMWYFLPIVRTPKVWGVPWIPWIPAASIGTNCFLLGSIDRDSFIRFGVFTAMIIVYYAFVGLHASYDAAIPSSASGLEINSSTKADPNHIDATTPAP